jgi:hypothetical protein
MLAREPLSSESWDGPRFWWPFRWSTMGGNVDHQKRSILLYSYMIKVYLEYSKGY